VILSEPERAFVAATASAPSGLRGVWHAATLLARVECPDADPGRVEALLERIARDLRAMDEDPEDATGRAKVLAALLAAGHGLSGDRETYDDPRNSCLECVLDRSRGIPLTLSLIWIEAARRRGWSAEGVGLPGHFVARIRGRDGSEALVDPFHGGGILTLQEATELLRDLHGRPVRIRPRDLEPARARDVLVRLLRNLRSAYRRRGDRDRALSVADAMLLVAPGLPEGLRDRGLLRVGAGDRPGGLADLRAFLAGEPHGPEAGPVLRLVESLTDDAELPN
jgi:regulator of sirC expression with transglutaminase-like and TPR domain